MTKKNWPIFLRKIENHKPQRTTDRGPKFILTDIVENIRSFPRTYDVNRNKFFQNEAFVPVKKKILVSFARITECERHRLSLLGCIKFL